MAIVPSFAHHAPWASRRWVKTAIAGVGGAALLGVTSCQGPTAQASVNALQPIATHILQGVSQSKGVSQPFEIPLGRPTLDPAIAQAPLAGSDAGDQLEDSWELTLYTPDDRCDRLVPQTVMVQGDRPIDVAIGRVLVEVASDNLDLRGYRLTMDTRKRTATVALRLRPGTTPKFMALSSCEQLTLFGSVRKTLMENSQWPIDRVIFTDGKDPIRL